MKKNILVIQSLLLLPLITPSLSSSMEKPSVMQKQQMKRLTPRQRKNKKQNQQHQTQGKLAYNQVAQKALGGEEKKNYLQAKEQQAKQAGSNLIKELEASFSDARKQKMSLMSTTKTTISPNLPSITTQSTNIITYKAKTDNASEDIDYDIIGDDSVELSSELLLVEYKADSTNGNIESSLLPSVILPTEKKGIGLLGSISYYTRDAIANILSHLVKDTFEVNNASYFELLNEAVQIAVERNAFNSLTTIAALCQGKEQYRDQVRISDDAAQKSFNLFETCYTQENKKLEEEQKNSILQYNQRTIAFAKFLSEAIDNYNQDIINIASHYSTQKQETIKDIELRKNQIKQFSALNASIREKTAQLIQKPNFINLENKCAEKIIETQVSLDLLLKLTSDLPIITEVDHKLNTGILS